MMRFSSRRASQTSRLSKPCSERLLGKVAAVRHEDRALAGPHRVHEVPEDERVVPLVVLLAHLLVAREALPPLGAGQKLGELRRDLVGVLLEQREDPEVRLEVDLLHRRAVGAVPLDGVGPPVLEEEGQPAQDLEPRARLPSQDRPRPAGVDRHREVDVAGHPGPLEGPLADEPARGGRGSTCPARRAVAARGARPACSRSGAASPRRRAAGARRPRPGSPAAPGPAAPRRAGRGEPGRRARGRPRAGTGSPTARAPRASGRSSADESHVSRNMKSGGYSHQSEKRAAKRTIVDGKMVAVLREHPLAGRLRPRVDVVPVRGARLRQRLPHRREAAGGGRAREDEAPEAQRLRRARARCAARGRWCARTRGAPRP